MRATFAFCISVCIAVCIVITGTLCAAFSPPLASKIFGFTGSGFATTVNAPSDGCAWPQAKCVYDGTIDYTGTSGAGNQENDSRLDTYTLGGAAVQAYQGSGTVDLRVTEEYNNPVSSTAGSTSGSISTLVVFAAGYSLDITYNMSGGGTVTQTSEHHPTQSGWTWDFTINQTTGTISSIDFDLEILTNTAVYVEQAEASCQSATYTFTTGIDASVWKL